MPPLHSSLAQYSWVAPLAISGIELAVVVGVEHISEGLHVAGRGRIEGRELIGLGRIHLAGAVLVEHEHAVTRPRPRSAMLGAVPSRVAPGI